MQQYKSLFRIRIRVLGQIIDFSIIMSCVAFAEIKTKYFQTSKYKQNLWLESLYLVKNEHGNNISDTISNCKHF